MIDFLAKGGVLVTPILFCSVMALAIFLERLIRFARMHSRGAGLAKKIAALLKKVKMIRLINSPVRAILPWDVF